MPGRCLTLDDPAAQDASVAGAKAGGLARARAAGLPVLPGVVVPVAESTPVVTAAGAALRDEGEGRARLAAMQVEPDDDLLAELVDRLADLGRPLIVRSSSPLEADGAFSGAFSSFHGIDDAELATALRGCWGSAFSVSVLDRASAIGTDPEALALAVLIQPELRPDLGGSARVRNDGSVVVTATDGPLRALMDGHVEGLTAVVEPDGTVDSSPFDVEVARDVAALARSASQRLDHQLIEWAALDGRVHLLQSRQVRDARPVTPVVEPDPALSRPTARWVAELTQRLPGALADELVLPWAVAAAPTDVFGDRPGAPGDSVDTAEAIAALTRATELADALTSAAWGASPISAREQAEDTFRLLRGAQPHAGIDRLESLEQPSSAEVRELMDHLDVLRRFVSQSGTSPSAFWRTGVTDLTRTLAGGGPPPTPSRLGVDRWEPFVHGVVMAAGTRRQGEPAAPGAGVGRVLVADEGPARAAPEGRYVLVSGRPLPRLGALLWNAAGLVTRAGSTAAHLLEAAESAGVPAVVGCDLTAADLTGADDLLIAVDGTNGHVAVMAMSTHDETMDAARETSTVG